MTTTVIPITTFAQRVRHARLARAMQLQVIEQRAGIGKGALHQLELGADQHCATVLRIAAAMDVDPRWLVDEAPIDPQARVPWCEVLPTARTYADVARDIGPRIRAARRWRGMTCAELARRAKYLGNIAGQYESGRHAPRLGTARRLADALDVDVVWLISGEGPDPWD